MTGDIRVLVYEGPHQFRIDARARPEPGPGQVLLRMAYVGICGSDLHGYTGESGRRVPGMVMGHEASGWVEEIGEAVEGLRVGEPVTFNPSLPCDGSCGHTVENQCSQLRVIGVTPDIQGAFADAIVVDSTRVVPLGDLDLLSGAMAEPMAVALHAVDRCQVGSGTSALVIGGGMIGQCIARAARSAGAARIIVSEAMPERRHIAADAGFEVIEPGEVGSLPPMDVTIDAVGVTATASAAIKAARRGGTVGFVGLGVPEVTIPLFDVVVAERKIVGCFCYPDSVFASAVEGLAEGKLDVASLLGTVEDFEAAHDAFESLATQERKDVKIVVATRQQRPGHDLGE